MSYELKNLLTELNRFIVGLDDVKKALILALLTQGHILLEGSPGLGKTTLAKVFAKAIGGEFSRIQMTPDLLPSDIIGSTYYNLAKSRFEVKLGPVFANVVLVDEINRASPKTQAALLEAMQERQVTIEGQTFKTPEPFLVIATQVPVTEGSYPLTETLIDRFAIKVSLNLPKEIEEITILRKIDEIERGNVRQVLTPLAINKLIEKTRNVYVSDEIYFYIVRVVNWLRKLHVLRIPPSPRASIWLLKLSRANALLDNRDYVVPDDVKAVAKYVLTHRVLLTPDAEAEGLSPISCVEKALTKIPVPK
mgnify:CR=1 FL=1